MSMQRHQQRVRCGFPINHSLRFALKSPVSSCFEANVPSAYRLGVLPSDASQWQANADAQLSPEPKGIFLTMRQLHGIHDGLL